MINLLWRVALTCGRPPVMSVKFVDLKYWTIENLETKLSNRLSPSSGISRKCRMGHLLPMQRVNREVKDRDYTRTKTEEEKRWAFAKGEFQSLNKTQVKLETNFQISLAHPTESQENVGWATCCPGQ